LEIRKSKEYEIFTKELRYRGKTNTKVSRPEGRKSIAIVNDLKKNKHKSIIFVP
jgi:hypothetical protein